MTLEGEVAESKLWQPVFEFFNDEAKTFAWFVTPNPLLGGTTPIKMILEGREKKLKKFIDACKKGYAP